MAPTAKKAPLTDAQKAAKAADRAKAKTEAFLKLAPKRMTNALKTLNGIVNLGNRQSYTYTAEQRAKIVDTLTAKVSEIKAAFADDAKAAVGGGFSF